MHSYLNFRNNSVKDVDMKIFDSKEIYLKCGINLFTVVCLVTWPLNGSEAGVDPVMLQTFLLFSC